MLHDKPVGAGIGHPAAARRDERDDAGAVRAALRHGASRDGASRPPEHAELARRAAGRPAGMASDIRADEWTDRGVVAQLGEHLHGMQGVGSSSPPAPPPTSVKSRWYRDGSPLRPDERGLCHVLDRWMDQWSRHDGDRRGGAGANDRRRAALDAAPSPTDRCARPGAPVRRRAAGGSLAGHAAQRGQPAVGGVLHRRDAAHRRRPGAGGRGRRRPDRHGADQPGATW